MCLYMAVQQGAYAQSEQESVASSHLSHPRSLRLPAVQLSPRCTLKNIIRQDSEKPVNHHFIGMAGIQWVAFESGNKIRSLCQPL